MPIHHLIAGRRASLFSFRKKIRPDQRAGMLIPFLSTTAIYTACHLISRFAAGLSYPLSSIWREFILQLLFAYVMFFLFRRRWAFITVQALLMGGFLLGHAAKVAFHGVPVSPDDLFAIPDLFWVLKKWQRAAMLGFALSVSLLFIVGANWKRLAVALAIAATPIVVADKQTASSAFVTLKGIYGNSAWDSLKNLVSRGATLHTVMEGLRYISDSHDPPTVAEVSAALVGIEEMEIRPTATKGSAQSSARLPNIHMILQESFWDPRGLSAAGFSRSPFDRRFLNLWKAAGFSKCMPPVYGGYTANSEFEALAGFPVDESSVKFERRFRNDVPALPHIFATLGYTTYASHPNVAGFWNRTNAYRRLGFETYWAIEHFVQDDMNGIFLSDESLYHQVLDKLDEVSASGRPVFNYMVTYTGHFHYPLNEKRPPVIRSESAYPEVGAFANTVYYKSKELADFIEVVVERDPDALIVVFGDHAPFLGQNHAGYRESHLLSKKMSDWSAEMLKTAYTTPLLIINGRKGPVKAGILPLYRLPALILSLLGIKDNSIMNYTRQPYHLKIRPLPGRQLVLDSKDNPSLHSADAYGSASDEIGRWMVRMNTLSEDLFIGQQFSLHMLPKSVAQEPLLTHRVPVKVLPDPRM